MSREQVLIAKESLWSDAFAMALRPKLCGLVMQLRQNELLVPAAVNLSSNQEAKLLCFVCN